MNSASCRRDPEHLLKKLHRETQGQLTVFLGAAAGVGKTFAMLENAHTLLDEGVDVVIGWVESHQRRETENLTHGLPFIPPRTLLYQDKALQEMDLDAILNRRPKLVLVDELAHTNVPGSRHIRRFQDVEEILNAGIDVHTTLNIQHLESLNDIVEQITGIKVRETIPDSILEQAARVQLIDIPPEDLIKRLKEGKVYLPGQVEQALKHFFRPGNINALREMSLRFTAHSVDQHLSEYMQDHSIPGPWPATEKLLVCVSASPFSADLIRVTRRMAAALRAEWHAVHLNTPGNPAASSDRERLSRNLQLARELGAHVTSLPATDMSEEILDFCRKHNITQMVVGKPLQSRLRELLKGGSLVDRLIRKSGGIQIHVIQGKPSPDTPPRIKTRSSAPRPWRHYLNSLLFLGAMTLVNYMLKDQLELLNIAILYLVPVLFSAARWGRGPAFLTALSTVLTFDFLFIPPLFSFSISDIRYLWSFFIFLLVALITGGQAESLRRKASFSRQQERQTRSLYDFSREIAAQIDLESILQLLAHSAARALEHSVVVLLADEKSTLSLRAWENASGDTLSLPLDSNEWAVASWAYQHGEAAGRSTETLPSAAHLYLPLKVQNRILGVLGLHIRENHVSPEEHRLIEAWANLAAIAVERIHLSNQANQAALLEESGRLHNALVNSVSHELRTPLAAILGSAGALLAQKSALPPFAQTDLLEGIRYSAERMERVITNLLDAARLESGTLKIKQDWCDPEDILGTALQRLKEALKNRELLLHLSRPLPFIIGDSVLLEQVLINLLDNALKYSPPGSALEIHAGRRDDSFIMSVADRGSGITREALTHLFEKFYRANPESPISGTGLGLSICKGILEAHGGTIRANNRPGGGACFTFTLPALTPPPVTEPSEYIE